MTWRKEKIITTNTTLQGHDELRRAGWKTVDKTWASTSPLCSSCTYRDHLANDCFLLREGRADDYLQCAGVRAEGNEASAAQAGIPRHDFVRVYPKTGPAIVIGSDYTRPAPVDPAIIPPQRSRLRRLFATAFAVLL